MQKPFNIIDLFSGGGGLSEGFHRYRFNIISCLEMNKYACQIRATGHEGNQHIKNKSIVCRNLLKIHGMKIFHEDEGN